MAGRPRDLSFSAELEAADNMPSHVYDFITPQYDSSNSGEEGLDAAQLSLEDDEDYQEEEENEEDENERYSRQRSRSRSFNEHDDNSLSIITAVDPAVFTSNVFPATEVAKKLEQPERSGPLQQREVLALKKGLEEATLHRNRDELIEEEEEKRAAESEKKKRTLIQSADLSSSGVEPQMRRVKILVLGDSGVGKSCLITRWTADAFSANIVSTVGVNFKSKRVHLNSEYVQVQVWDTAGQEHFHKITTSYYRGANGIMLVYDVSDAKTMENAEYWIKNIKAHASESVRVALIGNKTDLRTATGPDKVSCTDPKLATGYAEMFGVPYFETSAKESTNVDLAFMSMVEGIIAHNPHSPSPKAPPSPAISVECRQTLTEKAVKLKKGMFDKIRGKKEKVDFPISTTNSVSSSSSNSNSNSSSPSPTPRLRTLEEKEKCILS